MSIYNQFTYKQIYVNNYCLLVATLARYFHSFGWLTGFYASKTRYNKHRNNIFQLFKIFIIL